MSRNQELNRFFGARPTLFMQTLARPITAALDDDDDLALDVDEPPDHHFSSSPQTYTSAIDPHSTQIQTLLPAKDHERRSRNPLNRQLSLLTEGLLSASSMSDSNTSQPANVMARASSQASAYSLTSNHGLTSDGGFSSPAHSGTPSPPLPAAMQTGITGVAAPTRCIRFAGEQPTVSVKEQQQQQQQQLAPPATEAPPRKRCIAFAGAPAKPADLPSQPAPALSDVPQRPRAIKFACNSRPAGDTKATTRRSATPPPPPRRATSSERHATPRRQPSSVQEARATRETPSGETTVTPSSGMDDRKDHPASSPRSPSEAQRLEKERLKRLGSTRPEDEAWVNEKPVARKPITVNDTLRKENVIRQLAAEAEEEALDEALEELMDDDDEDDEDPCTGSRYMAFDEDDSDGGHETDDEEGFAESDDDTDDDPDFQFWTTSHVTKSKSAENLQSISTIKATLSPNGSESSLDSVFRLGSLSAAVPMPPSSLLSRPPAPSASRRRSPKATKMRPSTPELPDSTDFVCGTLDEDRPLEEAYRSCIKQRKLEKQGIIPQDLDPSFPTSDPENNDDDDEDPGDETEGVASTASDHHFLGGRFDESSDGNHVDSRPQESGPSATVSAAKLLSSAQKPRLRSPAPSSTRARAKSPAPTPMKALAKSPAPANMQRQRSSQKSPAPVSAKARARSPAPPAMQRTRTKSPAPPSGRQSRAKLQFAAPRGLFDRSPVRPTSPVPAATLRSPPTSPKNLTIRTSGLAQRPGHTRTASLPHTPNPFFIINAKRMHARQKKAMVIDNHDRGPIDIKQGLEERKQRRKEHYWRKHCRDHKDKARRCAPGKGAERMRELGIEMAHRNKAYGQKLQLMLSI